MLKHDWTTKTATDFMRQLRDALNLTDHLEDACAGVCEVSNDLYCVICRALGEGDYTKADVSGALCELELLMCIHPYEGRKRRTLGEAMRQGEYGILGGYDLLKALRVIANAEIAVAA